MLREMKKMEQAARAAWLYFVAGKTQQEIAHELGLSRQVAQRLISLAKEQGMVHVQITHPITECLKLATEIQEQYQLTHCYVVPSGELDAESVLDMIAVAGAELMEQLIDKEEPQVIGIGSGRTLRHIIDALPNLNTPQHQCVSLIGAIARDSSATRYDVPLSFAEKLHCRHYILPVPLYADSPEDKAMWCQHRVYKDVTEKAINADITFLGIGEVGIGCPLNSEGFITDKQVAMLLEKGVAAEMLGHFIQANGERLSTELDDTHTSVPLEAQTKKPVIAFSGGMHKYKAVKAVLNGRWISGLVTDEATARKLLTDA
ncbi:MAG TPA: DNA-binding transcriptional regulator [Providencia sp.]|uniref:sugar-binding transcriptional regulator n=1 Tax=Providencia sp. TaxID=589 RepID=UPI000E7D48A4|nr:sugar-binding transcriptional regulator [Providencia sp.]MBP6080741.1 sugar-binding transcriptional regulator [Providencia sp.]HBO23793.1 DNA-binding transcriptional regulator [Providencia sp.]